MGFKFRAHSKKTKRMIGWLPSEYLCVGKDGVIVFVSYEPNQSGGMSPASVRQLTNPEVDDLILEMATGELDSNGSEIYLEFAEIASKLKESNDA